MQALPFAARRARAAVVLVVALVAGCSSTNESSAPSAPPSAQASSAGSTPTAVPTPTVATLVATRTGAPLSSCVKGTTSGFRTTVWQPLFTATGSDVTIVRARLRGVGAQVLRSELLDVVDADAASQSTSPGISFDLTESSAPGGTDFSSLSNLEGARVQAGETVMPVFGVQIDPSKGTRGARSRSVELTYRSSESGGATGRRTVSAPLDTTWPRAATGCS